MLKPFSLFVGLRYTRSKRRNQFISFISFVSIAGITLGVMVLITVLSVMNGFQQEMQHRILGVAPHITILSTQGAVSDSKSLQKEINKMPHVESAMPFVDGQGLLTNAHRSSFVYVQGLNPQDIEQHSILGEKMISGSVQALKPGEFGILLGKNLAEQLGLVKGDKVTLVLPEASVTPAGVVPRLKRFTVVGLFEIGYEFDRSMAVMNIHDAQRLFRLKNNVSGINVMVDSIYDAPKLAHTIQTLLGPQYFALNWTQTNGTYFEAVKLEKTVMFIILMLIVAVAAFNILSTLVMVVRDKQADIAILRTLGASPRDILRIFMIQGSLIGIIGTFLGVVLGILLATNVTPIVDFIEQQFHMKFLASEVYYLSYIPSSLDVSEVVKVGVVSLLISFLATLYPAWRGARVQPAEALRYE